MLRIMFAGEDGHPHPTDAIQIEEFNDLTPNITVDLSALELECKRMFITWVFDAKRWEKELFIIQCVMDEVKSRAIQTVLIMSYLPNARMDRRGHTPVKAFTLKTFANIINGMGFTAVSVLDPHSDVAAALLDRCEVIGPDTFLMLMRRGCEDEPLWVFPDIGAMHRYADKLPGPSQAIFGVKTRDWKTQHITGYQLYGAECIKDKEVVIVDDIIAHGYTIYFLLKEVMKYEPKSVKVFVTHMEESFKDGILYKELKEGTIKAEMYTTDSIIREWSDDSSQPWEIPLNIFETNMVKWKDPWGDEE